MLDLVSVTRDHLEPTWASKLKLSAIFGWSQVERGDNTRDLGSQLYALSGYADLPAATVEGDAAFVDSKRDADGLYAGLGSIQRLGGFGTTFRANGSWAPDRETSKVGSGALLTAEINHGVSTRYDYVYLDGFWGLERFTSADRSPTVGGPLGRTGLLFSSVGLGRYGSPLNNDVRRSAGGALGWQIALGEQALARRSVVLEAAGRGPTSSGEAAPADRASGGVGARYQQAFGRHLLGIVDVFAAVRRTAGPSTAAVSSCRRSSSAARQRYSALLLGRRSLTCGVRSLPAIASASACPASGPGCATKATASGTSFTRASSARAASAWLSWILR